MLLLFSREFNFHCIIFTISDSRSICPHDCENGGECNASGQCECTSGYYGDRCELGKC